MPESADELSLASQRAFATVLPMRPAQDHYPESPSETGSGSPVIEQAYFGHSSAPYIYQHEPIHLRSDYRDDSDFIDIERKLKSEG